MRGLDIANFSLLLATRSWRARKDFVEHHSPFSDLAPCATLDQLASRFVYHAPARCARAAKWPEPRLVVCHSGSQSLFIDQQLPTSSPRCERGLIRCTSYTKHQT